MGKNKIYFISDLHLGLYPLKKSLDREKLVVSWLDEIKNEVSELYLLGDIFDFWHEYKHVIPSGFSRFFGKLAEMADRGTKIIFFTGNHDVWAYKYFNSEFGAVIHHSPIAIKLSGFKFFIGHGDGLGQRDYGYKLLKAAFTSKVLQWIFARLHPNFAMWIGKTWSKKSRYSKGIVSEGFLGQHKEDQIIFAQERLGKEHFDFFVFGHRHIPFDIQLGTNSRIINLGDWIYSFTYGEFNGTEFSLKQYKGNGDLIIREKYKVER